MKLSDHLNEFVWAFELAHDLPETVATDGVECFGEIDKICIGRHFVPGTFPAARVQQMSCRWYLALF